MSLHEYRASMPTLAHEESPVRHRCGSEHRASPAGAGKLENAIEHWARHSDAHPPNSTHLLSQFKAMTHEEQASALAAMQSQRARLPKPR